VTGLTAASTGRIAVIGGGIAGLAAAYELKCRGLEAVVFEAGDRPGGSIDGSRVAGLTVDSGPDGFVARDPAAAELCSRIGLGSELVTPTSSGAYVFLDSGLLRFPDRSVLGVPWTADALDGTGIVSEAGAGALRRGLARHAEPLSGDATVGEVLRPRVGDEVFERLVDPLLGGINAGSADRMSIEACAPVLYEAARRGGPLGTALQQAAPRPNAGDNGAARPPVFQSVRGGVTRMVGALAAELAGAVSLSTPVQELTPTTGSGGGRRWKVTTPKGSFEVSGVIAACPAWESARLLEHLAPDAAGILSDIEYADVALATFVVSDEHLVRPLDGSGFLVPRGRGLLTTACSWSSSKWRHYSRAGRAVLRVSAGRTDDRRWMGLDSDDLVSTLAGELAETGVVDRDAAARGCLEAGLRDWRQSLPQYRPGHLDRVAAVESCLATETPGLAVAGAALRGVGLPACIRSGQSAAAAVARLVL
jgi:oxygen-dependent protoporphyrinogen oxidase